MKVIVLGSGPAGLMAAQGVHDAHKMVDDDGLRISILSKQRISTLYGAQYLHQPIPSITPPTGATIDYRLTGTNDEYRRKVYGGGWDGKVSPEDLEGIHTGWDIRATYAELVRRWEPAIQDGVVDPTSLVNLINSPEAPDLIINTIPRPQLCHAGHNFGATEIWAAGDAPDLGIRIPYQCPEFTVHCNGTGDQAWYRISNVFGHKTVEWPGWISMVPVRTAAKVKKPTRHDCICWSDSPVPVMHVGRYGEWSKGVLSHTAYYNALGRTGEMLAQGSLF